MPAKKTPEKKNIMDVSRPGKTAAASTSKPVIITNRPILKDPMVVHDANDSEGERITVTTGKSSLQPKLQPTASETAPAEDVSTTEPAPASDPAPAAEEPAAESGPEPVGNSQKVLASRLRFGAAKPNVSDPEVPEIEDTTEEKTETEPVKEAEVTAPVAEEKPTPKVEPKPKLPVPAPAKVEESTAVDQDRLRPGDSIKDPEAETEEDKKAREHAEAIQKLVDSKQYNLPIVTGEKRRSRRVVVIGLFLSVVMLLVWVDIALDAGLIQLGGVKAVTHFFST
jgi:hypothetical protein